MICPHCAKKEFHTHNFIHKLEEKVFEEKFINNCILNTLPKRLWASWKVLTGKAGIILK